MVFNKIDLIDEYKIEELKAKYTENNDILFISVHDELGLEELKLEIVKNL
jgi:50S ribosomal subunit-associated GTPase HflX